MTELTQCQAAVISGYSDLDLPISIPPPESDGGVELYY
jgi:hypothetical protein